MFRWRRPDPLLIHDPDHDRAEREALAEAEFDALLEGLWEPPPPIPKIDLKKPVSKAKPPSKSTRRNRLQ